MSIILDGTNGITSSGSLSFGANAGTVGINFNNNTSGVGTEALLNDYETGTWTPNQGSGLTVVGSFTSAGTYTKIGNLVYVTGRVSGSTSIALSSTGIICTNLPFGVLATAPANSYGALSNLAGTTYSVINAVVSSIYNSGTAIAATPGIYFSVTYQATF